MDEDVAEASASETALAEDGVLAVCLVQVMGSLTSHSQCFALLCPLRLGFYDLILDDRTKGFQIVWTTSVLLLMLDWAAIVLLSMSWNCQ